MSDNDIFYGYEKYNELFEYILKGFDNDIEKMYNFVIKYTEHLDCFSGIGVDTINGKRVALLNYCRFKSDSIMHIFDIG